MANYDLSSFERNGNTYTYRSEIPIASAETLGGIKVGENLSIDPTTGVLSADGGSNVEDLDDLSDVTLSSPVNGQILKYNNGVWENANDNEGIPVSEKGAVNGVATLDANGIIPSSQLPSYVDDIIEGYLYEGSFYEDNAHQILITPTEGKIYVDLLTDTQWRWGGSAYTQVSESLALGETSSTAYAGNKGKANADAIANITNGVNINSFADVESALSTIPSALDDLSDVSTTGVTSGQVLTYNGTGWEGATPSAGTVTDVQVDNVSVVSGGVANISTMTGAGASAAGTKGLVPAPSAGDENKFLAGDGTWKTGGGSGASALDDLSDVTIVSAAPGDILKYDDVNDVWINAPEVQEMTQAAYNALTPAQKADGSVRYVYDAPTTELAETVLGTSFDYADLSNVNATELQCVVSFNNVIYAGFKFDLTTRVSTALTADEITAVATLLEMQASTNATYNITQDNDTPSVTWSNWDWYNTSTMYLDATDMSNVGVRNSYYEYSTSLLYKTAGSDNNSIYLNNRNYSGSGGGTTIIANSSGTPTDELNTIQIGNDIYEIAGGGGGIGYSKSTLYTDPITSVGEVTLSDDISNYDSLLFIVHGNANGASMPFYVDTEYILSCAYSTDSNSEHVLFSMWGTEYVRMTAGTANNKLYFSQFSGDKITGIYGIKFGSGSGGGGSSSIYNIDLLWDSESDTTGSSLNTQYNLLHNLNDYDIGIVMYSTTGDRLHNHESSLEAFFDTNYVLSNPPYTNLRACDYNERTIEVTFTNSTFTLINNSGETAEYSPTIFKIYGIKFSGGGSGASTVADLTDVELTNLVDKQVLRYNATTQKWENATAALSIVDITQTDYNLLTPTEKSDPTIIYHIIDGEGEQGSINRYGYTDPTMVANDGDIYYLLDANDKKLGVFLYKVDTWILIEGNSLT